MYITFIIYTYHVCVYKVSRCLSMSCSKICTPGSEDLSDVFGRGSQNATQVKGKGKAVPLQAWSGPEGSRKLRFPDFVTTAQDGVKVVSLTHRPPFPPGNAHFC